MRAFLWGLLTALSEVLRYTESPVRETRAAREQEGGQIPRVFVAELRLPAEEIERRTTNDNRDYSLALRAFCVSLGTLAISFITMGAVIWYAYIANKQWITISDQLRAYQAAEGASLGAGRPGA